MEGVFANRSEKRATWPTNGHRFEVSGSGGSVQPNAPNDSTGACSPLWGFGRRRVASEPIADRSAGMGHDHMR